MAASTCFKQDFVFSVCEFDCPKHFFTLFLLQAIFANSVLANPPFSQVAAGGSPRVPHIGDRIGAQTPASYFLAARLSLLCRDEKERGEKR